MDRARAVKTGMYWAAAGLMLAAAGVTAMLVVADRQGATVPAWAPVAMLVGTPLSFFIHGFRASLTDQAWKRLPRRTQVVLTAVFVVILIAANGVGWVMAKQQADDLQGLMACEDGPLEPTGNGTASANLAGSDALHPLLANDANAESNVVATAPFTVLDVVPTWSGPAMRISLSVRSNGEWFHGGTYEGVRSGDNLHFELSDPAQDAIKFSLTSPPLDEDTPITFTWTSLDRERC